MKFEPVLLISYGLLIVFSGLSFLALMVSNVNRIISLFDKICFKKNKKENRKSKPGLKLSNEDKKNIRNFMIITDGEEIFSLSETIEKAVLSGIANPWEIIDTMVKSDFIVPDNTGFFMWNRELKSISKLLI